MAIPVKKLTPKQDFVMSISSAGAHLPLSKNTINALAKFALNADDETITSLLELLAQPDPLGSLAAVLPFKIRLAQADWMEYTEKDFAQWVKAANLCFHAADVIANEMLGLEKATDESYLPARFAEGMRHYRKSLTPYSVEQMKDFALISIAAHCVVLEQMSKKNGDKILPDINDGEKCGNFWCTHLVSEKIKALAAMSTGAAAEIMLIIMDNNVYTEAQILYYFDGGKSALADGAI